MRNIYKQEIKTHYYNHHIDYLFNHSNQLPVVQKILASHPVNCKIWLHLPKLLQQKHTRSTMRIPLEISLAKKLYLISNQANQRLDVARPFFLYPYDYELQLFKLLGSHQGQSMNQDQTGKFLHKNIFTFPLIYL